MSSLRVYSQTARWTPWLSASAIFLLPLGALLEGSALIILIPVLDPSAEHGQVQQVVQGILTSLDLPQDRTFLVCLALFAILGALSAAIRLTSDLVLLTIRVRVEQFARDRMTEALLQMRYVDLAQFGVGEIGKSIVMEGWQIGVGTQVALHAVGLSLAVLFYLAAAALVSPVLTTYLILFGVAAALVYWAVSRMAKGHVDKLSDSISTIGDRIQELFLSMKYFKATGRVHSAAASAKGVYQEFASNYFRGSAYGPIAKCALDAASLVVIVSFLYVSLAIYNQSLAEIVAVLAIFTRVVPRLINVQDFLFQAYTYRSWYESWRERLASAAASREEWRGTRKVRFSDALRLNDVHVMYPGRNEPVLEAANLTLLPGQCVAIVGPSGSGKSTIVDLITGILRPDAGDVTVDNVPLIDVDIEAWRGTLGIVLQETPIIAGTVLENVVWGESGADERRAISALEQAGAWQFVQKLPAGIHTLIRERGTQFSGGERQRISVARALYKAPKLLIFDEATSALDREAEDSVLATLQQLKQQHSILWISHRMRTLSIADRIIELRKGRLTESTPAHAT